jgi:hypothetical protein
VSSNARRKFTQEASGTVSRRRRKSGHTRHTREFNLSQADGDRLDSWLPQILAALRPDDPVDATGYPITSGSTVFHVPPQKPPEDAASAHEVTTVVTDSRPRRNRRAEAIRRPRRAVQPPRSDEAAA